MLSLHRATLIRSEAQVQGGDDEQGEQGRGDQASQNDDSQRARDLLTGMAIVVRGLVANLALTLPVVLILAAITIWSTPLRSCLSVANLFGVTHGEPKHRQQTDQRGEREDTAGRQRHQYPAQQG